MTVHPIFQPILDAAAGVSKPVTLWVLPLKTHLVDETVVIDAQRGEICQMLGEYETDFERMSNRADAIVRAVNNHAALLATLEECAEYLENHSDVVDGSYGEPAPNKAMSLLTEVRRVIREGRA
ncbi:MAG: hypothetical protein KIT32_12105 [Rhodocyclaceae bacterium]|nr:hypothetical protein [Rhodocyclaceae bacterium]